jgi:hypothetical protein
LYRVCVIFQLRPPNGFRNRVGSPFGGRRQRHSSFGGPSVQFTRLEKKVEYVTNLMANKTVGPMHRRSKDLFSEAKMVRFIAVADGDGVAASRMKVRIVSDVPGDSDIRRIDANGGAGF